MDGYAFWQFLMFLWHSCLIKNVIIVYMDDILIFNKILKEYMLHVAQVLNTLHQHKLQANLDKCILAPHKINTLVT